MLIRIHSGKRQKFHLLSRASPSQEFAWPPIFLCVFLRVTHDRLTERGTTWSLARKEARQSHEAVADCVSNFLGAQQTSQVHQKLDSCTFHSFHFFYNVEPFNISLIGSKYLLNLTDASDKSTINRAKMFIWHSDTSIFFLDRGELCRFTFSWYGVANGKWETLEDGEKSVYLWEP